MELSLSKLPWYGQIGAFVLVCVGAVFGFWKFYVQEMQADIEARQSRLTALRADIARGVATARRLPQFQADVTQLEQRLDMGGIRSRIARGESAPENAANVAALEQRKVQRKLRNARWKTDHQVTAFPSDGA